jgi:hypothetical protein
MKLLHLKRFARGRDEMNILISEVNLNLARIQVRIPAITFILSVGIKTLQNNLSVYPSLVESPT